MPISPGVADELEAETHVLCECGHSLARHFGTTFECMDCHCIDFKEHPPKTIYERLLEDD